MLFALRAPFEYSLQCAGMAAQKNAGAMANGAMMTLTLHMLLLRTCCAVPDEVYSVLFPRCFLLSHITSSSGVHGWQSDQASDEYCYDIKYMFYAHSTRGS